MQDYNLESSAQEIHLREYLHIVRKRRKVIWLFAAITFCVTLLVTLAVTPQYKADTEVLIEKNKETDLTVPTAGMSFDPEFQLTQFEILKSNNVVQRVISRLQLDTRYRKHFLGEQNTGFLTTITKEISKYWGEEAPAKLIKENSDANSIAAIIQKRITTIPIRNSKIVEVSYTDPSPLMASMVTNALIEAYMGELLEIKMAASNYQLKWMTTKADEERQRLQQSEVALQNYRQANNIVTVENKQVVVPGKLAEFSMQLARAQAARKDLENVYRQIQEQGVNPEIVESLPVFINNMALQRIREQMLAADQKIAEISNKYGEKHPLRIKALNDRELLNQEKVREIKRLVDTIKSQYQLARSQEQEIERLLGGAKQEMLNVNEKMIQYEIMQRESETNRALYESLIKNIKNQGATEQALKVNVWVIKKAQEPDAPASPKKMRNLLLSLVIGMLGGVGCAFFVEYLDNTVKSTEEVERRFRVPVLGVVGLVSEKNLAIETIIEEDPRSSAAECYKSIRSSLLLSSPEHPPKTIMITSSEPLEGKTSTALNIARTLAQTGNVVLVDCDLRKPRLHKILNLNNQVGLSSILSGNTSQDVDVQLTNTRLSVITSGSAPPNPSELLGSERMTRLLQDLSLRYDYIVLDTPPLLSVTDALVLSSQVEGVVMVTRAGQTVYDILGRSLKMLQAIHAHLLGVVINGMSEKISNDYYYGGYYKQYYGEAADRQGPSAS